MIICHPLKLIFLKTKKTGGTSFEVALSKYCSTDCIITPISPADELVRTQLGHAGPVNFLESSRLGALEAGHVNFGIRGDMANHCSAEFVRSCVGQEMFENYTVVSIHREPKHFLISQYFFRIPDTSQQEKVPFSVWYELNKRNVLENYRIAPVKGELKCDVVFTYETLEDQITASEHLPNDFWGVYSQLRLKGSYRSPDSLDADAFYARNGIDPSELNVILKSRL